ncbi:hypothetical protein BH23GEM6_BH23GEM6_02520 [soil metagenome]
MKKSVVLTCLLFTPSLLLGQTRTTVAPYMAADRMAAGNPTMVGVALGWELGHVGLRWGVGMDAAPAGAANPELGERASSLINTDADAVLYILNPGGTASAIPYALGGLGLRSASSAGMHHLSAVWSAGGGVRVLVMGPVALEGEARHMRHMSGPTDALAPSPESGMSYRAGLSLRLGGRMPSAVPAPVVRPSPMPMPSRVGIAIAPRATAQRAVMAISEAERHLGVNYLWGGNDPRSGFDCSGFISYVFRLQGIDLPRVSQDQARVGVPVPLDPAAFQPGDLLAFASAGTIDHVAIYAGGGRIIHSSSSGGGVRYDDLNSQRGAWFLRHMVAARRVIESE